MGLYLLKKALYERYIDDSNQVAIVPPPGSKYDTVTENVVRDENNAIEAENEDERLARVLKEIANTIMPEIQMEDDFPSRNSDGKLPILDMKVWMDSQDGCILFEHYEKSMACKKIMHAQSAQSASCKKSVHTQEIVRRLLNCSDKLDWNNSVAPVISKYISRMMQAGYPENTGKIH